ncbi:MAG TPA: hypothetical protein VF828_03610 [Patescibacteria group bacterium]
MKSPKSVFLLGLSLIILAAFVIFKYQVPGNILREPYSAQNIFLEKLDHALNLAELSRSSIIVRHFSHQVQFQIGKTQVILTDLHDPYWQVTTLQKIFGIAKIKGKYVKFIDLSLGHPYATLQNN